MSRRRVYSPSTLAVMERFFLALDKCRQLGYIVTLRAYCQAIGAHPTHVYAQRRDRNLGYFQVGWLVPLIEQCHVSSYWLLTGKGEMFG